MRTRSVLLTVAALLLFGAVFWFSSLDKETRGLLGALPTDTDVLSWEQDQRHAAFRA
jgi:hypothetical protein